MHPMAQAPCPVGYGAVTPGNHEFNYGIETLREFEEQCYFPLLGAKALDAATLKPAFPSYIVKTFRAKGALRWRWRSEG